MKGIPMLSLAAKFTIIILGALFVTTAHTYPKQNLLLDYEGSVTDSDVPVGNNSPVASAAWSAQSSERKDEGDNGDQETVQEIATPVPVETVKAQASPTPLSTASTTPTASPSPAVSPSPSPSASATPSPSTSPSASLIPEI